MNKRVGVTNLKSVMFRTDPEEWETFGMVAKLNRTTISEILRQAIKDYLEEHSEQVKALQKAAKVKKQGQGNWGLLNN